MLCIKVTAEQHADLMGAMDIVVKTTGVSGLNKALPLLVAIQAAEEIPEEAKKPDLKVVENEE